VRILQRLPQTGIRLLGTGAGSQFLHPYKKQAPEDTADAGVLMVLLWTALVTGGVGVGRILSRKYLF
jgi:hypothetical protein